MNAKHILLVTHDESLQASRRALLEREGYQVDPVGTGTEALRFLQAHRYDLILIGRDARDEGTPLDRRLAQTGTTIPVLKIDEFQSPYAHVVGTRPASVLAQVRLALAGTLGRSDEERWSHS